MLSSPRSSSGRSRACRDNPGRLAHGDRQAPGDRPPAPQQAPRAQTPGARSRGRESRAAGARVRSRAAIDDDVGDDLLRLVFIACHPVLATEARVALTLRLLGGLTTEEIARAFLVAEPTIAQRIVRAKRTLADRRRAVRGPARVAISPLASRRSSRSSTSIFNEGYAATAGDDWMRPGALRGRAAPGPHPRRADAERTRGARARRADGDPGLAIAGAGRTVRRAHPASRSEPRALGPDADSAAASPRSARAEKLGGARGPYALQAAIAACHARARTPRRHGLAIASSRSTRARAR